MAEIIRINKKSVTVRDPNGKTRRETPFLIVGGPLDGQRLCHTQLMQTDEYTSYNKWRKTSGYAQYNNGALGPEKCILVWFEHPTDKLAQKAQR